MSVVERYKEILLSPRFHQAFAILVLQALQHYGIIDSYLANAISGLLGVSITIATVDKVSTAPRK